MIFSGVIRLIASVPPASGALRAWPRPWTIGHRDGCDPRRRRTDLPLQRPCHVLGGFVPAGRSGSHRAVEMGAELGQHGPDAADRVPQARGDRLAGPFGGAGPEWPGPPGEPGPPAQLRDQLGPLPVEVRDPADVVVVVRRGEVLVELGEAAPVAGAGGGVEEGPAVTVLVLGAGQH